MAERASSVKVMSPLSMANSFLMICFQTSALEPVVGNEVLISTLLFALRVIWTACWVIWRHSLEKPLMPGAQAMAVPRL